MGSQNITLKYMLLCKNVSSILVEFAWVDNFYIDGQKQNLLILSF